MKISNWLFDLFPFLFTRKKKAIRVELESVFQERWIILTNKLHVEDIPQPKFRVSEPHGAFHQNGEIIISHSEILKGNEELSKTIDHEIAHYIQYSKNLRVRKTYRAAILGVFYWFLTGRLNSALAKKAFKEGFATYVAHLTSGKLNTVVERTIKIIQSGKRWKMLLQLNTEILPYVLGYLAYSAIAQTKSEDQAIQLGLSADLSEWVSESRDAFTKLGKHHMM